MSWGVSASSADRAALVLALTVPQTAALAADPVPPLDVAVRPSAPAIDFGDRGHVLGDGHAVRGAGRRCHGCPAPDRHASRGRGSAKATSPPLSRTRRASPSSRTDLSSQHIQRACGRRPVPHGCLGDRVRGRPLGGADRRVARAGAAWWPAHPDRVGLSGQHRRFRDAFRASPRRHAPVHSQGAPCRRRSLDLRPRAPAPGRDVHVRRVRRRGPAGPRLRARRGHRNCHPDRCGAGSAWSPNYGTKQKPMRWNTCRIGYRVNPRMMPGYGMSDLREAMRRVTQVSGIRFRYLGRTHRSRPSAGPDRGTTRCSSPGGRTSR